MAVATQVYCQETEEILTNQTVVDMVKLGLGDPVIISKIKISKTNFDVTTSALIDLKAQGISDAIFTSMIESKEKNKSTTINQNDPFSPHSPGFYYFNKQENKLVKIDASIASETKSNTLATAFTYGIAKTKMRRVIAGLTAKTKVIENSPVFYFYPPAYVQNQMATSLETPNEYLLYEFKANEEGKSREVVIGKFNAYSQQSGIESEKIIAFDYIKKNDFVYEINLSTPLTSGEFAFMPVAGAGGRVYDFSFKTNVVNSTPSTFEAEKKLPDKKEVSEINSKPEQKQETKEPSPNQNIHYNEPVKTTNGEQRTAALNCYLVSIETFYDENGKGFLITAEKVADAKYYEWQRFVADQEEPIANTADFLPFTKTKLPELKDTIIAKKKRVYYRCRVITDAGTSEWSKPISSIWK